MVIGEPQMNGWITAESGHSLKLADDVFFHESDEVGEERICTGERVLRHEKRGLSLSLAPP